ncbi:hypothetical protein WR25_25695 [Diploscapter pachys]|uniref:UDP-N-acetylglucosamine 2-epimerase domain-containing protein n=1 Tax=Diploscapter pachys TaxID=2018661 RepID=A0A2A2K6H1_9BILA|nr:hypothetical protein WR25_25695 [Diploscapter pachys]
MAVIPAKRRKIPSFHMEAGNRCFDMRVPEEINRRIVDHTADINLTYSAIARDYLLAEGLPADRIIKTGSPMFEVLGHYREGIAASDVLERLGLSAGGFMVVSVHREENIDSEQNFLKLVAMLNGVAERYDMPIVVSTHPRTQKRIDALAVEFHPNEASILNFPALNLREAHERPEGMEEAVVMMVGVELERVLQGLEILAGQARGEQRDLRLVADYSMPNVSEKVVRILHSYTDYVNRVVWKRY